MHNSKPHVWVVVLSVTTGSCWLKLHVKAPLSCRAVEIHPPAPHRWILRGNAFKIELTLNRTDKPLLKSLCLQQVCQTHFQLEPHQHHGCPRGLRLGIKLFKSNHSLTLCSSLRAGILPVYSSCQHTHRGKCWTFQCITLTIPKTKRQQQTVELSNKATKKTLHTCWCAKTLKSSSVVVGTWIEVYVL